MELYNAFRDRCVARQLRDCGKRDRLRQLISQNGFLTRIASLSSTVQQYEDPINQELALEAIDVERLYKGADERLQQEENRAKGYDFTDCLVLETLHWFKTDFFKWTNEPEVAPELGKPQRISVERSSPQETREGGASVTEVYRCADGSLVRYPRYNNPAMLLKTRNGRCGEWANCFALILRSLGLRVRYVWNAEDHVWTEYWSNSQGRWIHLDSCEDAFDNPELYNKGWGKKMSYCIAVGIHGYQDVSKRYVVDGDKALPRDKVDESVLKEALALLTALQRAALPAPELTTLMIQDYFETLELGGSLARASPSASQLAPRQSGSIAWTTARGEAGN